MVTCIDGLATTVAMKKLPAGLPTEPGPPLHSQPIRPRSTSVRFPDLADLMSPPSLLYQWTAVSGWTNSACC